MASYVATTAEQQQQQQTRTPTPTRLTAPPTALRCICALCQCGNHSCATTPEPISGCCSSEAGQVSGVFENGVSSAEERYLTCARQYGRGSKNGARRLGVDEEAAAAKADRVIDHQRRHQAQKDATSGDKSNLADDRKDDARAKQSRAEQLDANIDYYNTALAHQASRQMSQIDNNNNNNATSGSDDDDRNGSVPTNVDKEDDDDDDNGQLLHVLVTKPEIASKPRDNIVFEGDMDLRTTFETSYEALARMRLDHWRRYQRQNAAAAPNSHQQRAVSVSPEVVAAPRQRQDSDRAGQVMQHKQRRHQQLHSSHSQAQDDVSRSKLYSSSTSSLSLLATGFEPAPPSHQPLVSGLSENNPKHKRKASNRHKSCCDRSAAAHDRTTMIREKRSARNDVYSTTDDANVDANDADANDTSTGANQHLPAVADCSELDDDAQAVHRAAPTSPPEVKQSQHQIEQKQKTTHDIASSTRQTQAQAHYIDKDLSPLIVYDANLNRLERVGQRRRSKYRPSTSLRPGASGFFGDTDTDNSANESSKQKQGRKENIDRRRPLVDRQETLPEEDRVAGTASGARQAAAGQSSSGEPVSVGQSPVNIDGTMDLWDDKTRSHLGARNLKNSHQTDGLVYTDRNLRIDSKRKLKDNVNMTDHIKSQNIVETAPSGFELEPPTTSSNGTGSQATTGQGKLEAAGSGGRSEGGPVRRQRRSTPTGQTQIDKGNQQRIRHDNRNPRMMDDGTTAAISSAANEDEILLKQLAEQEERAAVEEIQRCTGQRQEDDPTCAANEDKSRSAGATTRTVLANHTKTATCDSSCAKQSDGRISSSSNSESRNNRSIAQQTAPKSRLQRTCQHQNFDIFTNEYPKTSDEFSNDFYTRQYSTSKSSAMVKSKSSNYATADLFRESPDFILTTGADKQHPSANSRSNSSNESSQMQNVMQPGRRAAQEELRRRHEDKCRVLNLEREFDFVGSRQGHQYYAEKYD